MVTRTDRLTDEQTNERLIAPGNGRPTRGDDR